MYYFKNYAEKYYGPNIYNVFLDYIYFIAVDISVNCDLVLLNKIYFLNYII